MADGRGSWMKTPEGKARMAALRAARRNGTSGNGRRKAFAPTTTTDILTACQSLAHALVDAQLGLRTLTDEETTAIQRTRNLMYRHSVDSELAPVGEQIAA